MALLWATVTFTKNQPIGRELFGTLTSPMFLSMNLWPRSFTVPWIIGLGTPLTLFHAPPLNQSWPCIKSYAHTTRLDCTPGVYLPHTLAYYALDSLLLEGFGAGAYSAAVAALMAYRPPPRAEYSPFDIVLTCLGGIAMPPKIFQELLDAYYKAHSQQLQLANDS